MICYMENIKLLVHPNTDEQAYLNINSLKLQTKSQVKVTTNETKQENE